MTDTFYDLAKRLDTCKADPIPSREHEEILYSLIREEKFAKYFFYDLDNPVWIIPLHSIHLFYQSPDPIEVKPGSFQLPGWPAGEYLVRFGDQFEDIVVEVVRTIRTENWRVQEILVDAMMKIAPSRAAELVYVIDMWLSGRFSDLLPIKLTSLADFFIKSDLIDSAINILEYVITPVLPSAQSRFLKYHSPVRFRANHYWINEYIENQFPKLIKRKPISIITAFERQLNKTIELTRQDYPEIADLQVGYHWRMDIPNRLSERSDGDVVDILVDGIRDGLVEVCRQSIEDSRIILSTYLNVGSVIFRRIAMYILRIYGEKYPEMINQVLSNRDYLEKIEYANEYLGLMRDQFGSASEEVKAQVISLILSGPSDIDGRAERHAQWQNREVAEKDREEALDDWVLFHLEIIRSYLSGKALLHLDKLTAKYGKPDIEERQHIVTASWGGAPSPLSAEEIAVKSFDDLKQFFLTYVPNDFFLNPRESLAETFKKVVSDDPQRYMGFAAYLKDPKIRYIYTYHFLSGVHDGVKNNGVKLNDEVIILCEFVTSQEKDPFEESSGEHESGLSAAQLEVARLLVEALRSEDSYLSRDQLDRIRSILINLSHHPDPKLDADSSTSFDPFTHSLNCVRGVAMHGIFYYSLYIIRTFEKRTGQELNERYIEPEIQEIIEEKLDLSFEPSLAVRSVYGAFVPQLHYLSREWLESHLPEIFPEADEKNAYWRAAWDAYIFVSNVYRDVFELLVPQYQRGIKLLGLPPEENKFLGSSPNERLAQHLLFAYLNGLTEYGHENMLLDLFYTHAPDGIRARGIFWLSQVLENKKPTIDDALWKKSWNLWQRRLETAETQDISKNSHEISNYIRWLEHVPVELDILYPTLRSSIKYFQDGYDVRQLIEYAAANCDHFPIEAVDLLQMSILSAKESWWSPKDEDEERILKAAMLSGEEEARRIAIEVINYRGEQGNFNWKYLLE